MEKTNVAELLKDCPKGTELDCTICNGVKFIELDRNPNFPIVVRANNGYEFTLTRYGQVHNIDDAKCVIFPKGKTTWEGFIPPYEFKDGDIVVCGESRFCEYVSIFKTNKTSNAFYYHAMFLLYTQRKIFKTEDWALNKNIRLANEEEKAKLFQAIKDNGYKWNAETKTLEKLIEPKFKVGDRIIHKINKISPFTITEITDTSYKGGYRYEVLIEQQDNFELAPNKFDINTLVPFESKVLVRAVDKQFWRPAIWGVKHRDWDFCCVVGGEMWEQCIPYEGNEHLRGIADDCDEYYKYWE